MHSSKKKVCTYHIDQELAPRSGDVPNLVHNPFFFKISSACCWHPMHPHSSASFLLLFLLSFFSSFSYYFPFSFFPSPCPPLHSLSFVCTIWYAGISCQYAGTSGTHQSARTGTDAISRSKTMHQCPHNYMHLSLYAPSKTKFIDLWDLKDTKLSAQHIIFKRLCTVMLSFKIVSTTPDICLYIRACYSHIKF